MPKYTASNTGYRPNIFLLQGPNMNYLGKRQPELYGSTTAAELDEICRHHADRRNYALTIHYSNSEGEALDGLYQAREKGELDGLVMNPAAWSVGAGASIRFCILGIAKPYIEVHLRNQYQMQNISTLADLALGVIQGFGIRSYTLALDAMYDYIMESREI